MFGLNENNIKEIKVVIGQFPEVQPAKIFGSRAKGNYKHGSDVDIALFGNTMSNAVALKIAGILNEDTNMPYHFDVLNYNHLKNSELIDHIDRVGQLFFKS
jgi:uncharacterized protein